MILANIKYHEEGLLKVLTAIELTRVPCENENIYLEDLEKIFKVVIISHISCANGKINRRLPHCILTCEPFNADLY